MPLLTYLGTFLFYNGEGQIVHREIGRQLETDQLIDSPINTPAASEIFNDFVSDAAAPNRISMILSGFGTVDLCVHPDRRLLHILQEGRICRVRHGHEHAMLASEEPSEDNGFVHLSDDEYHDLIYLLNHDWLRPSNNQLVLSSNIHLEWAFQIMIGGIIADLRDNLPFLALRPSCPGCSHEEQMRMSSLSMLFDGWRADRLILFRPLVYSAAFRSPVVLDQWRLCMQSLLEIGGYRGRIHVVTDQALSVLSDAVEGLGLGQLSLQVATPKDFAGYCGARHSILDYPDAHAFQPLLYIDPDVIFDQPVQSLLIALATASGLSAPAEPFSPMRSTRSVGSHLLWLDGCDVDARFGFNSGTLGIPNLAEHASTLRLIRAALVSHARKHGRDGLPWADQEMSNYLSFKIGGFETETLSRFVRHGFEGIENDPQGACGMVHFWPPGDGNAKLAAMRHYFGQLDRAQRTVQLGIAPAR